MSDEDEQLDEEEVRRSIERFEAREQLFREMLRVDPELRGIYERPGSGGIALPYRVDDVPRLIELLRTVPDDAGREAARALLAPYVVERQRHQDDGTAWRNRTRYDVGPNFDRRAANATILALRATVPNPEEARWWGYGVLPGYFGEKRSEVVDRLVKLEKPVRCVAVGIGGALVIGAWSIGPPREGTPGVFEKVRRDTLKGLRKQYGDRDVRVLLVGDGEDLVMTAQELEEWKQLYTLLTAHPIAHYHDPLIAQRGVDFVVRFARPEVMAEEPPAEWGVSEDEPTET